ncbi:anti-sigma regulatory factor [Clostridiaceae bacterium M8S5]|nr:anti-sigma regulatory factor [Clostridiaceae bacterium M8S5]
MDSESGLIVLEYDIIQNDFSVAGEASSNLKKVLKQLGIPHQIIRRVAIAAYEAEINIVIHSNGGKIIAKISPEDIELIAKDNGPGIKDLKLAMTEGYSTASNKVREMGFGAGMGLPNIKRCSDEFNLKSDSSGTQVTIKINFFSE